MSRPAHIAPLDEALTKAKAAEVAAAERYAAVLDEHIEVLDEVEAAKRERVDAFHAIGNIEKAILKLGYCLLAKPFEGHLVIADEMQAARDRRTTPARDEVAR